MGQRLDLHEELCTILGSRNVYFQPPTGFKMVYPCIVYSLSNIDTRFAENRPYVHFLKYTVTSIDRDPESETPHKLADLPMSSHNQQFVNDNLYHNVFTIYY